MTTRDFSLRYAGDRTGFLLVHGLGGTPAELRLVVRALHRAGRTVHCPQLAGHCGTEADLVATGWRDWANSVLAELERMRETCERVIVGGLSMGAVLALHAAAERPDAVDGLALYAPTLRYDGWSIPRYAFLLKWLINTPAGRRYSFIEREPYGIKDPRVRNIILNAMTSGDSAEAGLHRTPSRAVQQMWQLITDTRRRLSSITCPALLVHARDDDVAGLSNAFEIQRRLGGLVDAVILDDSYHLVTIDQQHHILIERSLALAARLEISARRHRRAAPMRAVAAQ
ncbi:alpha/beta hydrolase [Chelatococcus asaccharovorans]|uniref:alpha/beta hydrolase n=1 Tax=Chelatococcus asaccharovorans TaxID=28210 RepID=UPI00224C6F28|nr:alpha/beta fold hydrolase [Chelatococcus asaccharovorans]CAH1660630.1 Esterase/lipase [Chelatococcus asaccharovorans]CAH1683729.1 Esterase/lipase [Chelatococcus asaccharovorans]